MKTMIMISVMALGLWAIGLVDSPSAMAVSLNFDMFAPTPAFRDTLIKSDKMTKRKIKKK